MLPVIIGILSGILVIVTISLMKGMDKATLYGLVLSAIGFLYVGYTWSDLQALIINSFQALVFFFLAYFGIRKSLFFLVAGYFLHGAWDLIYHFFPGASLIPPHYDLFCLSIDFTMGFYLLRSKYTGDRTPIL